MTEQLQAPPINKAIHLLIGGAATALLFLPWGRRWRLPLMALAAIELGRAFTTPRVNSVPTDGEAAPEVVQSALVDNILMRWEEHGDKSDDSLPVIMVHGIPTHPRLWRYVIPRITSSGVRCLAWEQVGFGWSMAEGLGRDISVARQAEYLYSWLHARGIKRAVFVGHDLGGGVIQRLVTTHPELCAGLVLMDCIAYDNWPVIPVRLARPCANLIEWLPPSLMRPFFLAGLWNLGHDAGLRRAESTELHWQPYARPIGPRAFAHQLRHLDSRDTLSVMHALPTLHVPARVIWGMLDPLGLPSGEQLAVDLRASFRVIAEGRHFTPEDHPGIIAEAINEVLAEVLGQQARVGEE